MRFLRIDTNKGNKTDGGFLHTVFESTKINGKSKINKLSSTKFNGILSEAEHIEQYKNDPDKFLGGMVSDETDTQSDTNISDGSDAA